MWTHVNPHARSVTCTCTPPSKLQRENPILTITCYSRWNLAYTGVEGKNLFPPSPLQTKTLHCFTEQSLLWCVCKYASVLVGLVCPGFTSPLGV